MGTASNDTFNAGAAQDGAGNLINTLQNVDVLDGAGGRNTLNVTLAENKEVTATIKNIQTINVRSADAGAKLNLSATTGAETINVTDSTLGLEVNNLGTIANLGVKNQNAAVTFKDNKATALNFTFDTVGKSAAAADVVTVTADTGATSATITANNANVQLATLASLKTVTVDATGNSRLDLDASKGVVETITVKGAGKVNLDSAYTAVKSLDASANEGGVTVRSLDSKAVTVKGGTGDDNITFSDSIAATANIDLGAGNDRLTIDGGKKITQGATLNGGAGEADVLAMDTAAYENVSTFSNANLAKITGFEILGITDVLADTKNIDVSKIAGITGVEVAGVTTGEAATVSNLGATTSVTMKGNLVTNNGELTIALKDASGSTDAVSLTLNHAADLTTSDVAVTTNLAGLAGVETLNVKATATDTTPMTPFTKNVIYTVDVKAEDAAELQSINISGDQKVALTSTATMIKLATIDASANTAGVTIDASNAATAGSAKALTIIGSEKADVITGTNLGDAITLGGGNDIVDYKAGGASGIGSGKFDTITDFNANTFGNGADGAAGKGAGAQANWTGDVLQFAQYGSGSGGIIVDTFSNAADATTFLQTAKAADTVVAALDSSTGNLYLDNTGDGVADYFINLTGVTSIDAAAFNLVA